MATVELLDEDKLWDELKRQFQERVKESEKISETRHLHVIDCYGHGSGGNYYLTLVAAILNDPDKGSLSCKLSCGGWVDFIGYEGRLENLDISEPLKDFISKPLKDRIEIKKSERPHLDFYLKTGKSEKDYQAVKSLRELADTIEQRYIKNKA